METIEMDLMQAQIGELTTEVTRLDGKSNTLVKLYDLTPTSPTKISGMSTMSGKDIGYKLMNGSDVIVEVNIQHILPLIPIYYVRIDSFNYFDNIPNKVYGKTSFVDNGGITEYYITISSDSTCDLEIHKTT